MSANICFHKPTLNIFLFLYILLNSYGCINSGNAPFVQKIKPAFPANVCQIAVLPFENNTDYQQGSNLIYRIFMTELQRSGNYNISLEGDVRKILRQLRVGHGQRPDIEQLKVLADTLNTQVVITGQLIDLDEEFQSGTLTPKLTINIQISDGLTGEMIWHTYHSRTGEDYRKVLHFGYINTISKLTKYVSQEIIELWFKKGLPPCLKDQPS